MILVQSTGYLTIRQSTGTLELRQSSGRLSTRITFDNNTAILYRLDFSEDYNSMYIPLIF